MKNSDNYSVLSDFVIHHHNGILQFAAVLRRLIISFISHRLLLTLILQNLQILVYK